MEDLAKRLAARDLSLWPAGSVAQKRLGWLDAPREAEEAAADLRSWADSIDQATVVLLGMGGSSLGPAVLGASAASMGWGNGRRLVVCDTTDPDTVASLPAEDTFYLVSSKSGTTLEPRALAAFARSRQRDPRRFAAITDPGTPLAKEAEEAGFARVFLNRPDIGGRYSVLSLFGLVPAALLGLDLSELAEGAAEADMAEAASLGAEIGQACLEGRDKLTIEVGEDQAAFGLWIEQLVAESTGKQGKGCVPVPTTRKESGPDRYPVAVSYGSPFELAREFFRWEVAVAIVGHVLQIDPFDEPNVAESKENTQRVLENLPLPELPMASAEELGPWLSEQAKPGDYVSLQAYIPFGHDRELEQLRRRASDRLGGLAATAGYGPRFLHSTGQLHKGGPNTVLAVQILPRAGWGKLDIPGFGYDFATLIAAQAIGDYQSLVAHGRRVIRTAVDELASLL